MPGTSRNNEACSSLLSGRLDAEVIAGEMELPVAVLARTTGQAELRRICQLWNAVVDLYAGNKAHALTFLRAPNRNLEGQAPADLIESGDLTAVEAFVDSMTLRTTT